MGNLRTWHPSGHSQHVNKEAELPKAKAHALKAYRTTPCPQPPLWNPCWLKWGSEPQIWPFLNSGLNMNLRIKSQVLPGHMRPNETQPLLTIQASWVPFLLSHTQGCSWGSLNVPLDKHPCSGSPSWLLFTPVLVLQASGQDSTHCLLMATKACSLL